jgi:hypothetical protein
MVEEIYTAGKMKMWLGIRNYSGVLNQIGNFSSFVGLFIGFSRRFSFGKRTTSNTRKKKNKSQKRHSKREKLI